MSKQDFILIANVIKNAPVGFSERAALAVDMMAAIATQRSSRTGKYANEAFDKARFLEACANPNDIRPMAVRVEDEDGFPRYRRRDCNHVTATNVGTCIYC